MENKTLREICEMLDVSRRAVQGYEKAGLVSATGKNKYGYLLYDESAQKRIEQIRLYQKFGFKIREIKEFIDEDSVVIRELLESQVLRLKEERINIDKLIEKAYELIDAM